MARRPKRGFNVGMSLEGDKELLLALKALDNDTRGPMLREVILAASEPVVRQAKANAPRDTLTLQRSIDAEIGEVKDRSVFARVGPGSETEVRESGRRGRMVSYGLFSEFGVHNQTKQEWLRPAVDAAKRQFESILRTRLARVLLKHARGSV